MSPTTLSAERSSTRHTAMRKSSLKSPDITPTRKQPHCTQCRRPKAGHPRQGCPYIDSESPNKKIADALGALDIKDQEEETKSILRSRRASMTPKKAVAFENVPSLASLSTQSSEIVRNILQSSDDCPTDDDDTDTEGKVRDWQRNILTPTSRKRNYPHSGMPGTLITPESSFASHSSDALKEEAAPGIIITDIPTATTIKSRRVERTLSAEEREMFMQEAAEASKAPPASLFRFATDQVEFYIDQAIRQHRMHARIVSGALPEGEEVLVVMGKDEKVVNQLYDIVRCSSQPREGNGRRRSSGFKAAAGGAVVGAVAAFTGLAYS